MLASFTMKSVALYFIFISEILQCLYNNALSTVLGIMQPYNKLQNAIISSDLFKLPIHGPRTLTYFICQKNNQHSQHLHKNIRQLVATWRQHPICTEKVHHSRLPRGKNFIKTSDVLYLEHVIGISVQSTMKPPESEHRCRFKHVHLNKRQECHLGQFNRNSVNINRKTVPKRGTHARRCTMFLCRYMEARNLQISTGSRTKQLTTHSYRAMLPKGRLLTVGSRLVLKPNTTIKKSHHSTSADQIMPFIPPLGSLKGSKNMKKFVCTVNPQQGTVGW